MVQEPRHRPHRARAVSGLLSPFSCPKRPPTSFSVPRKCRPGPVGPECLVASALATTYPCHAPIRWEDGGPKLLGRVGATSPLAPNILAAAHASERLRAACCVRSSLPNVGAQTASMDGNLRSLHTTGENWLTTHIWPFLLWFNYCIFNTSRVA